MIFKPKLIKTDKRYINLDWCITSTNYYYKKDKVISKAITEKEGYSYIGSLVFPRAILEKEVSFSNPDISIQCSSDICKIQIHNGPLKQDRKRMHELRFLYSFKQDGIQILIKIQKIFEHPPLLLNLPLPPHKIKQLKCKTPVKIYHGGSCSPR